MTRALKAVAAVAGALILALLLASAVAVLLILIAWPVLAVLTFATAREGLGEALGLKLTEETSP